MGVKLSLSHCEEYRLMVLGNIMGLQRHKLTANWRKLHNEELRDL
jgi:hypothetical protein